MSADASAPPDVSARLVVMRRRPRAYEGDDHAAFVFAIERLAAGICADCGAQEMLVPEPMTAIDPGDPRTSRALHWRAGDEGQRCRACGWWIHVSTDEILWVPR